MHDGGVVEVVGGGGKGTRNGDCWSRQGKDWVKWWWEARDVTLSDCCWDWDGICGEVRFWFRLCRFCMRGLRVGDWDWRRKLPNSTLVEEEV